MLSKRKTDEINISDVKKVKSKINISSYIEQEREKMMVNKESYKSIENYLYQSLKRLKDTFTCYSLSRIEGYQTHDMGNMNVFPTNQHGVPFPRPLQASYGTMQNKALSPITRLFEQLTRRNPSSEFHQCGNALGFNMGSDPIDNRDRSSARVFRQTNFRLYKDSLHNNRTDAAQNFNLGPDPMWGPHFENSSASTVSDDVLVAQLIVILGSWNLDFYHKCMDDYNSKRNENPEFWDKMLLRVLPPVMLEHCIKADIVADFFHTIAKYKCSDLVNLRPSYLQFFLMNMAAVNRIECSLIVETDKWNSAKRELIVRAFVAGQLDNLKLLLQYFRPNDLWSCADMEFLKAPSRHWESRLSHIENIEYVYCDNLIMLNLVRLATYVSESAVSRNILTDCIRLFWRASETPYITLEVLSEAFKPLNSSLLLRHTLIRACKNALIDVYPKDCLAEYQPRSLMHLCRCNIRKTIISAVHVPSLPLPQRMIDYINLEW